ncbi:hypothetical protein CKO38_03365 [Rhodospirillum rubrum]|uniref:restriction endonuclease subunit S n=1 Tax=Rhodospirillum rubrum TaxID=1085 RepID=UPI001906A685|nr:restriction endonuclease subunit S [Rhodospirillum rubrum]MBK1663119.1 hypothetical protein [Rhodospirillum rubrum]MBK1675730.1 hypothetical protein [Rhodospirillum rubrum]
MSSNLKSSATTGDRPALVPKLRFSEFRDAGEWNLRTLASLVSFSSGGTPSKDNPEYWNGNIPWISASSMHEQVITTADHHVTPLAIGNGTRIAKAGAILILVRGSMLFKRVPICLASIDVAFNQDVKALKVSSAVDTNFLLGQMIAFQSRLPINETGIGAGKIELDSLSTFPILTPSFTEQQKIADCLDSLDALIAAQRRKVEALRVHKKGLMQQLFPQEGETQPRLRFPEFEGEEEWEKAPVRDVILTVTPPKKIPTSDYQSEGVFPIIDQSQNFISGWTNDGEALIGKGLPVIIFGDHTCALKFVSVPFVQGADGIKIIRPKRGICTRFLFYSLEANAVVQDGYKRHFSALKEKIVLFPDPKSGEQHRIADCLTSLDDVIAAEGEKLDTLKTHKKGLMQQLFPQVGED